MTNVILNVSFYVDSYERIRNVIDYLNTRDKVTAEHTSLGLFLIALKDSVGWEERKFIDEFMTKHDLIHTSRMSAEERILGSLTTADNEKMFATLEKVSPKSFISDNRRIFF